MKKYIVTHANFIGELEFRYNPEGVIYNIDVRAAITLEQTSFIMQNVPVKEDMLQQWAKANEFVALEIPLNISYDTAFWPGWVGAGGVQANKERGKKLYEPKSVAIKVKACWSLKAYRRFLQRNSWISPQYPDTYLSNRKPGYENDWDKM